VPTETEIKLELDAAGAERVVALGVVERRIQQLNVYYDDASLTVRIRFTPGAPGLLTVKLPRSWEGFRRTMEEIEVELVAGVGGRGRSAPRQIDVERDLPRDLAETLRVHGYSRLRRSGWARNQRTVVALPGAATVEVDRLRLPDGTTIYEVEIETPDRVASDRAVAMIQQAVPGARPSRVGKYERFRAALLRVGGGRDSPQ